MRCLPSLSSGATQWHLPLSPSTAELLAQLLLEPDDALDSDQVVSQLRADPAFALWALCKANQTDDEPRTLEALAKWLCDRVASQTATRPLLAWDAKAEAFDEGEPERETSWCDEAQRLTASAQRLADIARNIVCETSHAQAEEVLLVALLCDFETWFAIRKPSGAPEGALPVPAWLTREIATARGTADAPPGSVAWSLKAALYKAKQAANNDHTPPKVTKEIWSESISPWARLLPRLASRLARLDGLEHHFDETIETEKLEAMAELAAGAGHEINNPLAVISGRAQLMLRDENDPQRRRTLGSIHAQALRVHEMISDLMLFARPPRLEPCTLDLVKLLDEFTTNLISLAEPRRIRVTTVVRAKQLWVEADPVQLTVALRAITDNAVEAIGEGGQIHIEAQAIDTPADHSPKPLGQIEIVIRDDGPGIAPEVRRHLFDPFYSGRSAGRGLGFGLTKCWRIVTAHGGEVHVSSEPGSGTEFRVTLPESASTAAQAVLSGDRA